MKILHVIVPVFLFPFIYAEARDKAKNGLRDDPQAEQICVLNNTLSQIQIHRTSRDLNVNPSNVFQLNLDSKKGVFVPRRPFPGSQDTGTMLICGGSYISGIPCDANTNGMAEAEINAAQQGNCGEKCELTQTAVNEYKLTCTALEINPWDLPCPNICDFSSNYKKHKKE